MDCREGLNALDSGCVDLTVTSPPYNIGKAYESPMDVADYVNWCREWLGEIGRVVSPNGALWLNLGYLPLPGRAKALPIAYLLWDAVPMHLIQEVVWNYGAGVAGKLFFSPRNEKLLWFVRDPESYTFNLDKVRDPNVKYPNQRKNGKLKVNPLGKNPSDVWQIPKVTSGQGRASTERTAHPAQFPVALIDRVVLASSNPGDVVLDPFMGSGTTAVVGLRRGRSVVGFELREEYCEIAARRIEKGLSDAEVATMQGSLFPLSTTRPTGTVPPLL
jgi:adenine-specific DNA-methyltransferase